MRPSLHFIQTARFLCTPQTLRNTELDQVLASSKLTISVLCFLPFFQMLLLLAPTSGTKRHHFSVSETKVTIEFQPMSSFWALVSSSEDIAENSIPSGISETYMNNIYKPHICSSPYWSASPPSTLAQGTSQGNTHPHFLFILSGPSTTPLLILDFGVKVFTSLEPEGRAVLIFPGNQVEFRYLATHLAETLIKVWNLAVPLFP